MDLVQQLEQADADRVDGITTDKQYMERRAEIVARAVDYDDLIMQAKERALLRGDVMDSYEMPDPDEAILERWLIRWGLLGVIAGLVMLNVGIFYLWRYALSLFYPGA